MPKTKLQNKPHREHTEPQQVHAEPVTLVAETVPKVTFADLGVAEDLLTGLRKLKFDTPSDIQRELIPVALRGQDCLGQAKTGTGKTAAFSLPMMQLVTPGGGTQALVLVPTRELAMQVDDHVRALGSGHPCRTVLLYGGTKLKQQIDRLKEAPEIVVGTPGRVLDMAGRRHLHLSQMKLVILDEVDRMLDIGFREDIRRILKQVTGKHQTIFVSATIDDDIRKLAKTYMHEPVEINVSRDQITVDGIRQGYVTIDARHKFETLRDLLVHEKPTLAIVFTNMKSTARKLSERLKKAGVNCKEIHGDLDQKRRERVMKSFRNADIHVLVATDLASRGLDVIEISHIINYDIPADTSVYVHRIGRTARMGREGHAITFVTRDEGKLLTDVEKLINKQIEHIHAPWVRELPPPEPSAATPDPAAPPKKPAESRLATATQRDAVLDSMGLQPLRRTLGSRFRTRRGR